MFVDPSVDDFKEYFSRDFPYGTTDDKVKDSDIEKAFNECSFNFNQGLFSTQDEYTICFLYLSAHYLVMDLQASSQGIAGQFTWLQTSKTVGSVSESFGIPDRILKDPMLSYYSKTRYGAKYISLIMPRLTGQIFAVWGGTNP